MSLEVFVHTVYTLLVLFPCEDLFDGRIQSVSTDTGFEVSRMSLCIGCEYAESGGNLRW